MIKILYIFLFFFFLFSSANANFWDILYVKNDNTLVRDNKSIDSNIIKVLKKWYIVIDRTKYKWNIWTKVELTDWNIWYIYNFNLLNNESTNLEIKWNIWIFNNNALLRNTAYWDSYSNIFVKKWTYFKVLNINYINNYYVYVEIINWINKWKKWFVNKKYLDLYCVNQDKIDIFSHYYLFKNIKWWKINTYCDFTNFNFSNIDNRSNTDTNSEFEKKIKNTEYWEGNQFSTWSIIKETKLNIWSTIKATNITTQKERNLDDNPFESKYKNINNLWKSDNLNTSLLWLWTIDWFKNTLWFLLNEIK